MKIAVGCDHRGIEVKHWMMESLRALGHEVVDAGTHSTESCDYPDVAAQVARQVARGEVDQGVLICGTGIGMSITANKQAGVRAALCWNEATATLARQHNNANVLCVGSNWATRDAVNQIVTAWVNSSFEGGRHERRVAKIQQLETVSPDC